MGSNVGEALGSSDGSDVGSNDGYVVGVATVGYNVGSPGPGVGLLLGNGEGSSEGSYVGGMVGKLVGYGDGLHIVGTEIVGSVGNDGVSTVGD